MIANVGLYGAVHESSTEGTGPKQDSRIMIVVIPGRNGTVSLVENVSTILYNAVVFIYHTDSSREISGNTTPYVVYPNVYQMFV